MISMLENLLSRMNVKEKKSILVEKYGMEMTVELEGRIHTMCNWSEGIAEMAMEQGMKRGMEKGREEERVHGVRTLIETCKELKASRGEAFLKIKKKYDLTEEDAKNYMNMYWN